MSKARQYDSPILRRIEERIPKEISEQIDRRMGLAVKIAENPRVLRGIARVDSKFVRCRRGGFGDFRKGFDEQTSMAGGPQIFSDLSTESLAIGQDQHATSGW